MLWCRLNPFPTSVVLAIGLVSQVVADKCSLPVIYPGSESIARQSPLLDGPIDRLFVTGIDVNIPSGTKPDIVPILLVPGLQFKMSCAGANPSLSLDNGELVASFPLNADNVTEIGCEFVIPTTLQTVEFDMEAFFRPDYLATIEPGFINLEQVIFDWERDQLALTVSSPKLTILKPISENSLIVEEGGQVRSSGGGGFTSSTALAVRGRIHGGEVNFIDALYLQGPILAPVSGNRFGGSPVQVYSSFGCSQVTIETCQPVGVDISLPLEHPCTVQYCASQCIEDESGFSCVGTVDPSCVSLSEGWQHDPVGGQEIAPSGYDGDCPTTDFIPYNTTWSNVETILVDYNFPEISSFNSFWLAALTIRPVIGSEETIVSTTPSDAVYVEFLQENGTLVLSPADLMGRTPERVGILVEVPSEQLLRVEMGLAEWAVRLESGFTNFQRIVTQFSGVMFAELSSEAEVVLESPSSFASITVEGGALVSHEIKENVAIKGTIINGTGSNFLDHVYVEGEITQTFQLQTKLTISSSCDNIVIEGDALGAECSVVDTLEVSLPQPFCALPYCESFCDRDESSQGCSSSDCSLPEWYHNAGVTVAPTTTIMPVFVGPMTTSPRPSSLTPSPTKSPGMTSVDETPSPVTSQPVMAPVVPTSAPTVTTPDGLPSASPVASGVTKHITLSLSKAFMSVVVLCVVL